MRKAIGILVPLAVATLGFGSGCQDDTATAPMPDAGSPADAGWTAVGGGAVAPGAAASGVIAASNGTPYAAFSDSSQGGKLTVMKFDGTQWVTVGNAGFSATNVSSFSLYVDNGTPFVAFADVDEKIGVMKFSGTWMMVGNGGFAVLGGNTVSLVVSKGGPIVAFRNDKSEVHVMAPQGGAWADLGGKAIATSASAAALGLDNGQLWLAFTDSSNNYDATLMKYDGTSTWTTVATSPVSIDEDWGQTLMVNNGVTYVCYRNGDKGAVLLKLNGTALEPVGTLGSLSPANVESVSCASSNGVPYVALDDEERDSDPEPRAAEVKYYDGKSWQLYAGYPSSCDIENTFLASDSSNGHLYLTYTNCDGNMTVQVR